MAVANRTLRSMLAIRCSYLAFWALWLGACATEPTITDAPEPSAATPVAMETKTQAPTPPIPVDTLYDLLVAEIASNRNQYPLALENYQRQAFQTRDPQITAQATRLANAVGSPEQTERLAQLWLELEPANADAHFILAIALGRQGRSQQAFNQMQKVDELDGNASYARIAADALNQTPAERSALLNAIDSAISQQPNNVELLMAKSIVEQASDEQAALDTARKARKLAPEHAQTIILEASLLKQMSRSEEAIELLEDSIRQAPDNLRVRRFYAQSLFATNPEKAVEQFQILLDVIPNDPDTIFFLALTHTRLQQYDAARKRFEQLLSLGVRQSEAHYHLGLIALHKEDSQLALEHFERVEPGQEYLGAMTQVARILIASGKPGAMHQHFTSQREIHPTLSVSLYILESDIYAQLNNYDAALQLLDEALQKHSQDTRLLYARALAAEQKQDIAAAERDLRQILTTEPDNAMTLNALGYLLTNHSTRYREAEALIQRALNQKPDDPTILDSMGWVHYRLGNFDRAVSYLEQAYQLYPDAEIGAHLGEVLWHAQQRDRAIDIWQESLRRDPEHEVLRETLNRLDPDNETGLNAL